MRTPVISLVAHTHVLPLLILLKHLALLTRLPPTPLILTPTAPRRCPPMAGPQPAAGGAALPGFGEIVVCGFGRSRIRHVVRHVNQGVVNVSVSSGGVEDAVEECVILRQVILSVGGHEAEAQGVGGELLVVLGGAVLVIRRVSNHLVFLDQQITIWIYLLFRQWLH